MQPRSTQPEKKEKREKKAGNARGGRNSFGKAASSVGKFLSGRKASAPEVSDEASNAEPRASPSSESEALMLDPTLKPSPSGSSLVSPSLAGSSESSLQVTAPVKVAAVLCRQADGKPLGKGLCADAPVEDFLAQGLLPVPDGLLQVSPLEPVGSVVERIYQWRLRSCIVAFPDGKKEFFDCADFARSILEAVAGADGMPVEEDWKVTKRKLRSAAEAPVGDSVQGYRGAGEFRRFDADGSLFELLKMFHAVRRVPVYRRGELCRVVTPSDILEMCFCVSEDSMNCLEATMLTEMVRVWPGIMSDVQVTDDFSVVEVLQALRDSDVSVTPVVEGIGRKMSGMITSQSQDSIESIPQSSPPGAHTLVGQFDAAALRVLLVHLDPDEGSWWWEDESLTRNILLEPCMDYLSLSGTVIVTNSDTSPFNIMKAEETLMRSITKVLTSNYQSVVVYPGTAPGGDSQASARGEPKFLSGAVSTLALVIAMLQGGLFEVLNFDPSLPRRELHEGLGTKRTRKRRPTLTRQQSGSQPCEEVESPGQGGKSSKVKFCPTVELDCLDVPTCPEHGIRFLKFVQDGETKYAMDFRTIQNLGDPSRVAGAAAQCTCCSRPLGRVRLRPKDSPMSPMQSGLLDRAMSDNWFLDLPFMKRSSDGIGFSKSPGTVSPMASALKPGTNFPLKKSKTAERLDAIQAREKQESQTTQTTDTSSKSAGFFGVCCSPCRMLSDKDQIQANSMTLMGGESYSREDTSEPSPEGGASPSRTSGRSTPMNKSSSITSSGEASALQSAAVSPRSGNGSIPRLSHPGMSPNSVATRVVREGTDRARFVEVKDGARRCISDPMNGLAGSSSSTAKKR